MKSKEKIGKEKLDEYIHLLLQVIIDDLRNYIDIKRAGWRNPSTIGIPSDVLNQLHELGILEKSSLDEVRVRFEDANVHTKLATFETQFKQIDYFTENQGMIKEDEDKIEKSKEIIQRFDEILNHNNDFLFCAVAIGLWRMLNTSDMSAIVDDILKEGFSPKDWAIASTRAVPYLSLSLAQKTGKGKIDKLEDAFQYAKKMGLIEDTPSVSDLNSVEISKIKRVLKWEEFKKDLTEENVKLLGLSWFIVFILEVNEALPSYPDFSITIVNFIKEFIEKLMNANYEDLTKNLKASITKLEQEIGWAPNFVFLPEVI